MLGQGAGTAWSSDLLGPLFGDLASAAIFERTTQFDPSTVAVIVVEDETRSSISPTRHEPPSVAMKI